MCCLQYGPIVFSRNTFCSVGIACLLYLCFVTVVKTGFFIMFGFVCNFFGFPIRIVVVSLAVPPSQSSPLSLQLLLSLLPCCLLRLIPAALHDLQWFNRSICHIKSRWHNIRKVCQSVSQEAL